MKKNTNCNPDQKKAGGQIVGKKVESNGKKKKTRETRFK